MLIPILQFTQFYYTIEALLFKFILDELSALEIGINCNNWMETVIEIN